MSDSKSKIVSFLSKILKYLDPFEYVASMQLDYVYKNELKFVHFISVRSIINNCTFHNINQRSDIDRIDFKIYANEIENKTYSIFINSDSIESFVKYDLQLFNANFIIFIGNSDIRFDNKMIVSPEMQILLKHPLVSKLYIQNLGCAHDKISFMPIGLDFHTLWEKPKKNGFGFRITPLLHQKIIYDILRNSKELCQRENLIYCNWHFEINRGDRRECYDEVDKKLCYFEKIKVNRFDNYKKIVAFRFVLCPSGLGWDSYRIWETLLMGSFPILKINEFTKNLENLPCILVEEWSQINFEFLKNESIRISESKYDFSILFNSFWINVIEGKLNDKKYNGLTTSQFRKLMLNDFNFNI